MDWRGVPGSAPGAPWRTVPLPVSRPSRHDRQAHSDRRFPAHTGANVGGLSFATQAVAGARGVARNDASTCCAQGEASVTKWPIPGNTRTVELVSVRAAIRAQLVGVTELKLPASIRVGILLGVAARCSAGAFGTFHTRHWSAMYVTCSAGRSTESG